MGKEHGLRFLGSGFLLEKGTRFLRETTILVFRDGGFGFSVFTFEEGTRSLRETTPCVSATATDIPSSILGRDLHIKDGFALSWRRFNDCTYQSLSSMAFDI